ncbi:MAG: ParB N-terminal domain-containing protein [Alphaproteobacteria bacterium]
MNLEYRTHPAAEIFPLLSGAELDALVADIKEHGLREPVVLFDGAILDGRNRYRACQQLGVKTKTVEWDGEGTPEAFVVSMNLHRRHLNESQRGMIAAKIAVRPSGDQRGVEISIPSLQQAADLEDYIQANLSEPMAEPVGRKVPRLPTPDEKG